MLMLFHVDKGQGVAASKNFAIRLGSMGVEWSEAYKVAQPVVAAIQRNDTAELWTDAPAAPPPIPPGTAVSPAPSAPPAESAPAPE